jgi:hypothetical protein
MKIHGLLAALVLAAPATTFADRRVQVRGGNGRPVSRAVVVSNRGHSGYHGYSGHSYRGYSPRYYGGGYSRYGYGYGLGYYSSPSVVLSYSNGPRYYSDSAVDDNDSLEMDVQQALRRRGYYRGVVDGDIGPGSRSAIRAYQADRGLSITGRIDGALLRSLNL